MDVDPVLLAEREENEDVDADEQARELGAYERAYEDEHSWEMLQEDEQGRLMPLSILAQQRAKRKRLLEAFKASRVQRGVIRYLQLVVDWTRAAAVADIRPYRGVVICRMLERFVREFFDQNPLSQMGVVVLYEGIAVRASETSGSPDHHIQALRDLANPNHAKFKPPGGSASLQNALEEVTTALRGSPTYGHREALFVVSALSSCDPGNVMESLARAKSNHVRVSVVGVSAEVYICKHMAEATGGTYHVAVGEGHLEEIIQGHVPPPPLSQSAGAVLMRVGFPQKSEDLAKRGPVVDQWKALFGSPCPALLQGGNFLCPQCKMGVASLPAKCNVCGLVLLNAQHIARSYHHLFPVIPFREVPPGEALGGERRGKGGEMEVDEDEPGPSRRASEPPRAQPHSCFGCYRELRAGGTDEVVLRCPTCKQYFCFDCDAFIHDSLHNCPGCECDAAVGAGGDDREGPGEGGAGPGGTT